MLVNIVKFIIFYRTAKIYEYTVHGTLSFNKTYLSSEYAVTLLWLRLGWSLKGQSDSVGLGLPLDEKTLFMSCQALAEQDHRSKELLSSDSSDG